MITRTIFQEVAIHPVKYGVCKCGKKRKRSTKFSQTLNPWNKNAGGEVKTVQEVHAELVAKKAEWILEPILCEACK